MILNLSTNFEFSSLWNYHFTLYVLKCKKVKLMVAKWGVNSILVKINNNYDYYNMEIIIIIIELKKISFVLLNQTWLMGEQSC